MEHCTDVGCMMEDGHCSRSVHAEANAIVQAAKNGVCIDDAVIYTTASPCWGCFKLIANAGIIFIVYGELYRDERISSFAAEAGIELLHLKEEN
jgi:dCMP deaminase